MSNKVAIIQELFPIYRGSIFDRLNSKYNLLVVHGKPSSDHKLIEKDYSIGVPVHYFFNHRFVFLSVLSALRKFKPEVVIHQGSPGNLSLPITWFWCKLNNAKFAIWTHGFERHQGFKPKSSFRSLLRLIYLKISDAAIFYTKGRQNFFKPYVNKKKLFYANNTLDTDRLLSIRDKLSDYGIESLQKELNMFGYSNLVFSGRLLQEKLVIDLLRVTLELKNQGIKIKTHIIGDGKEAAILQEYVQENNLQESVIFYGAVYDDEYLGKIMICADLMVHPGDVGLAINHAFCYDLPLITYEQGPNGPYHGPEIEYLEHNKTGLLIEPYNIIALFNAVKELLMDHAILVTFKNNVRKKITQELTIEQMALGFKHCLDFLLNKK